MKYELFYQLKNYAQQHPEQFKDLPESCAKTTSLPLAIQEHFTGSTNPVPVPAFSLFNSR